MKQPPAPQTENTTESTTPTVETVETIAPSGLTVTFRPYVAKSDDSARGGKYIANADIRGCFAAIGEPDLPVTDFTLESFKSTVHVLMPSGPFSYKRVGPSVSSTELAKLTATMKPELAREAMADHKIAMARVESLSQKLRDAWVIAQSDRENGPFGRPIAL